MYAVWAIWRRELIAHFTTPMAWLVLAVWCFLTNGVFAIQLTMASSTGGANEPLYLLSLQSSTWFLAFIAPAITMGSFATEREAGTLQLLLTVPVTELHIVAGKFLGAFTLIALMAAVTLAQPAVLSVISDISLPQLAAGYLGMGLLAAFLAALGVWLSLIVDSAVAAYVITFGVLMLLNILALLVGTGELGLVSRLAGAVSHSARLGHFLDGDLRSGDVAYFIAGTTLLLAAAHATLTARRLHG